MDDERRSLVFVNLNKYTNKTITVKLASGEEVCGRLVSYDQVPNLVLEKPNDEGVEWPYGSATICIGTNVMSIALGVAQMKFDVQ